MKCFAGLLLGALLLCQAPAFGQTTDLSAPSEDEFVPEVMRTFRVINLQSIETLYKNDLFFSISHKFGGTIGDGISEFFGMDQLANIRFELAYGLTDNFTVGVGRTRYGKVYDGFLKYKLLSQTYLQVPVSVTLLTSAAVRSEAWPTEAEREALDFAHRMSYLVQGSVARKFGESFSLQLTGSLVHRNLTEEAAEVNTVAALGGAARVRITDDFVLLAEYNTLLTRYDTHSKKVYDVIGFGFDITSARHSYKFHVSNTTDFIGQEFLTETYDDFFGDGLHFGFHITRYFAL